MANRMIHTPSYLSTATLSNYWPIVTGGIEVTSGWYHRNSGTPSNTMVIPAATGVTVGMKFKADAGSGQYILCLISSDGTDQVALRWNGTSGFFYVTRETTPTTIATGTTPIAYSTEYYVEIQWVIHDTTGVAILKIDGVTDAGINSSALDTRNGAPTTVNQVQFGGTNNATVYWKDMYINDNSGGVDDTFWGPIAVASLTPSGAGTTTQWTPLSSTNVSNVDDAVIDADTTYNATSTNGQIDSFVVTDTGYASGTVLGVEHVMQARRTDASATARLAPLWRIGSTDYPGTDTAVQTTYRVHRALFRQSPATTSAWTVSELDSAEVGYKRTAA